MFLGEMYCAQLYMFSCFSMTYDGAGVAAALADAVAAPTEPGADAAGDAVPADPVGVHAASAAAAPDSPAAWRKPRRLIRFWLIRLSRSSRSLSATGPLLLLPAVASVPLSPRARDSLPRATG